MELSWETSMFSNLLLRLNKTLGFPDARGFGIFRETREGDGERERRDEHVHGGAQQPHPRRPVEEPGSVVEQR